MSMSLFGIVLAHTLADRRMTGRVARVLGGRHRARLAGARDLLDYRALISFVLKRKNTLTARSAMPLNAMTVGAELMLAK